MAPTFGIISYSSSSSGADSKTWGSAIYIELARKNKLFEDCFERLLELSKIFSDLGAGCSKTATFYLYYYAFSKNSLWASTSD